MVAAAVIFASLSFWFGRVEMISNTLNHLMVNFATYPDGIFKTFIKVLFYTIIPIGFTVYLPVKVLTNFNITYLLIILLVTAFLIGLAFLMFYRGLRRYSSSNLMNARM